MCFSAESLVPALMLPIGFSDLPVYAAGVVVKATFVLLVAFVLATLLRRASASYRHLVWSMAVACLLLMPLASLVLPTWHIDWQVVAESARGNDPAVAAAAPVGPVRAGQTSAGAQADETGSASLFADFPLAAFLLAVWAAGFFLVAGRLWVGARRFTKLARDAEELSSGDWSQTSTQLATQLALKRPVPLLKSERVSIPMTAGFRRPVILLPNDFEGWTPERRWVVLAHEMFHVRRADYSQWMLARLVCALYWFHPLVWFAAARLRREAEQACDDGVLRLGAEAADYAEHLVSLARGWSMARAAEMSAMAMAQSSHLEKRIRALLDPARNRRDVSRRACLGIGLAAILVLLPLAAVDAPAQAAGASLKGTVSDASGARVPGARILVQSVRDRSRAVGVADDAGEFAFDSLPAGGYVIEVRKPGFQLQQQRFTLESGARETLAITLDVGGIVEELVIVGKASSQREPSRAGGPPRRIRVGGNVQRSKLLTEIRPIYPQELQREGIEGMVVLDAVIATDGSLKDLRLANDLDEVDERLVNAATEAIRFWRYEPTRLNGEPVEVLTSITLNFRLEP